MIISFKGTFHPFNRLKLIAYELKVIAETREKRSQNE
jgi:hypothetical protein